MYDLGRPPWSDRLAPPNPLIGDGAFEPPALGGAPFDTTATPPALLGAFGASESAGSLLTGTGLAGGGFGSLFAAEGFGLAGAAAGGSGGTA